MAPTPTRLTPTQPIADPHRPNLLVLKTTMDREPLYVDMLVIKYGLYAAHYRTLQSLCERGGAWMSDFHELGKLVVMTASDMTAADWRRLRSAGPGCRDRMAGGILAALSYRRASATEDAEYAAMWSAYYAHLDRLATLDLSLSKANEDAEYDAMWSMYNSLLDRSLFEATEEEMGFDMLMDLLHI